MKTKEVPVKNNPGIFKRFEWDEESRKWVDTGKYRSTKRVIENGVSKRKAAVFGNFEDAKAYRQGLLESQSAGTDIRRLSVEDPSQRYTFKALIEEWKELHYLELEFTSRQYYDTRLPHLESLYDCNVEDIDSTVVTKLVKFWVSDKCEKPKDRQKFEKELDVLKLILNFYRRHKNRHYFMPILPEHYRAADIAKKQQAPVRSLREEHLGQFLITLKDRYPHFYPIALTQLGFGLRIGEALALRWEDLDLENREAVIGRNIAWNRETRELVPKKRKNARVLEVVIPEFLIETFKELHANRALKVSYLFHRDGELLRRQQVSKAYGRILEAIGVKYVSGTHMMRKTSGILARKITRDVYAASKLLGHSSVAITEKYYQEQLDEDKQKVADALNGVFDSVTGRNDQPPQGDDRASWPLMAPKTERPKLKVVSSSS